MYLCKFVVKFGDRCWVTSLVRGAFTFLVSVHRLCILGEWNDDLLFRWSRKHLEYPLVCFPVSAVYLGDFVLFMPRQSVVKLYIHALPFVRKRNRNNDLEHCHFPGKHVDISLIDVWLALCLIKVQSKIHLT